MKETATASVLPEDATQDLDQDIEETVTASVLPEDAAQIFRDLYQAYQDALLEKDEDARVEAARTLATLGHSAREDKKWTLPALAKPLGITPEGLRQLIGKWYDPNWPTPDNAPDLPQFVAPPRRPKGYPREPKPAKPTMTRAEERKLAKLGPIARLNNGVRALNDPIRLQAEEFSQLIIELADRGITWAEIAAASGHKVSGIRMRAARHGHGNGPPKGVPAYRRIERHPTTSTQKARASKAKQKRSA